MISFVTSNRSKFTEVCQFLQESGFNVPMHQVAIDLFEIQTRDQRSIALHKAQEAWKVLEKPLLIDDSGIYLEKYGAFPGTLTKYVFQGIGYRGLFRLVDSGDKAVFITNLIFVDQDGNPHLFEGKQEGEVVKPERLEINNDFPFDQIFIPYGSRLSYAELALQDSASYSKLSYRQQALAKFVEWYKEHGNLHNHS